MPIDKNKIIQNYTGFTLHGDLEAKFQEKN